MDFAHFMCIDLYQADLRTSIYAAGHADEWSCPSVRLVF